MVAGVSLPLAAEQCGAAQGYLDGLLLVGKGWFSILHTLYALDPALLHTFFDIGFIQDSSRDKRLFEAAAPVAMAIDPTLRSALIPIANANNWAEPVPGKQREQVELADDAQAGGDVHMQPLMPVSSSLDGIFSGLRFAGTSTGKTFAGEPGLQLHIAAGNVLCVLSRLGPKKLLHSQL